MRLTGVLSTLMYQDTKSRFSLCVSFCLSLCMSLFHLSLSVCLSVCLSNISLLSSFSLSLSVSVSHSVWLFLSVFLSLHLSLFLSLSLSLSDGDSTDDVTVDGLELIIWVEYKALPIVTDKIRQEKNTTQSEWERLQPYLREGNPSSRWRDGTGTSWHILC